MSTLGGHNLAIATDAANKGTAADFIKFMSSEEVAKADTLATGQADVNRGLYSDPDILKKFPHFPILLKSIETANPRPKVVKYGDATLAMQDAAYGALQGQAHSRGRAQRPAKQAGIADPVDHRTRRSAGSRPMPAGTDTPPPSTASSTDIAEGAIILSSTTFNIGVLGAGQIAQAAHFPAVRKAKTAQLYAICDAADDLRERMAAVHQPTTTFADYDAMLADDNVDAVIVAVADQFHVPLSIKALEAGKHVLVEKPMATTVEDAEALLDAAKTTTGWCWSATRSATTPASPSPTTSSATRSAS